MTSPWMKFYPSDWQSDPMLRCCSIAARGLWVEMMCLMHKAEPYGTLLVNGASLDKRKLAILVGISERECTALLTELESNGVFSRDDDGAIYSRRMRRDFAKAEVDKANGKKGGNPSVKGGVNPPVNGEDKAQKPESHSQPLSPEELLNNRIGGEVKAKNEPKPPRHGAVSRDRKFIYFRKGTPEFDAYAEDFRTAHGCEPEINAAGGRWFDMLGQSLQS